jgi:FlaA1/EpsC-like NDP-sugar epimerase
MNRSVERFLIDLVLWTLAAGFAFFLRLDMPWPEYRLEVLLYPALGVLIKAGMMYLQGTHRPSWHRIGLRDLYQLTRTVAMTTVLMFALAFVAEPALNIPRSIPILEGALGLLAMAGARALQRVLRETATMRGSRRQMRRVLIAGAGEAGTFIARELLRHPESGLEPIGFLDDAPEKVNQRYVGLPVLGPVEALPIAASAYRAEEVLIAIPSASGPVVRRVVELARQANLKHRIIPGVYEILSGKVSISQIREIALEDLLRREPIRLDNDAISSYLHGRVVLVTGAGGSIGSEIVRQIARFRPKQVILYGRGENSLYQIERELLRTWPELEFSTVVGDVRNRGKLGATFAKYRPQVVFHAAAHKHVPLMEQNPDEAIINNVGGTQNVVSLCLAFDIERLVNISTDKAVNPTSVMGASKRVGEYIVEHAARQCKPGQNFVSVRFGNVLGSRGSVIPLFQDQIKVGGPVTVTDPEMTRYFMTIPEASQLVLQAGIIGQNGSVCVLDMGEPVNISDLAKDLIRLSGFEPGVDIDIVYSGMRPGEKLYEELLTAEEGTVASTHTKIFMARKSGIDERSFEPLLENLFLAARVRDEKRIRELLRELIPTATISVSELVHLDSL